MFNPKKSETLLEPFQLQAYDPSSSPVKPLKPFSSYSNIQANHSVINEWLTMRGDLESSGDILVKGKVHGNIRCRMLIIDAEAQVDGRIDSEEVVIRGGARGLIHSTRVRIENTGHVHSEIYHESFSAEEGARVRGSLHDLESSPELISVETLTEALRRRAELNGSAPQAAE